MRSDLNAYRFLLLLAHGQSHIILPRAQIATSTHAHGESDEKPAGVFSPKLSRILPQRGAISPSPSWLKKFEPTVIKNPMTIRRFFIIVIEKYLGKE
ncbi:hypothetical protein AVEN_58739-1 [Araneus ventricosus]|uniref:Uncharacterized protein n=1 Tax=Araneus ventricosus TaxID=182803 RepID=A0A4Y2VZ43_ARAVE|nr:hypothetical protein AVEN_58739-1 [Araneus ventricosus]